MMKLGTYLIGMAAAILAAVSCNIHEAILYSDDPNATSPYDKNVDFGFVPTTYYVGQQDDYSFGKASTRTADIYDQFDLLADGSYISRETIGKASNGSEMYMYRLTSPTPSFSGSASRRQPVNKLKIIIISHLV